MKQESLTLAGHAAVGFTAGISGANRMGWFDFISANAGGISVMIGACSLFCAICFYVVSYRKQGQADKNKIEIEAMKQTYKDDHNELSKSMSEIKDLLRGQANGKAPRKRKDT